MTGLVLALKTLAAAKEAPKAPDPVLRAYYCQAKKFDGVFSKLPRPESDFMDWLDCGRRDSPGAEQDKKSAEEFAAKNARWKSRRLEYWMEKDVPFQTTSRVLTAAELKERAGAEEDDWIRAHYAKALPGDVWLVHFESARSATVVDAVVDLNEDGGLLRADESKKQRGE